MKKVLAAVLGLALVGSTVIATSIVVADPAEAGACYRRIGFYC